MLNRDEFIREVTIRICSSLQIKVSLQSTFEYLKREVPLDALCLSIIDTELGAVRNIATAVSEAEQLEEIVPLPEELLARVLKRRKERPLTEPFIVSERHADDLIRSFAPIFKVAGNSRLVVPLAIEGERVGNLALWTRGEGKYGAGHLELLREVAKPFAIALANALAHEEVLRYRDVLLDDNSFLNRELHAQSADQIIGAGTGLRNVTDMVRQIAPLRNTVLLLGETGTGKEVIANLIHFSSNRKDGPFIKVNCGAIPEQLIDSELFGHKRGAFTGAIAESRGRFERADGGTIFLDEIGELPLPAQVRLLRVLQSHEVERVGGGRPVKIDIRVIAATHRNLERMVAEGRFREDLWFRLNGFPIIIPPVRQRKGDIAPLIRHFMTQKSRELGVPLPAGVAPGALKRLMEYHWPGNVRELENLVERELIRQQGQPLTFDSVLPVRDCAPAAQQGTGSPPLTLDEAMAAHIGAVLRLSGGKIYGPGGAAEFLRVNPDTLRWRMNKLGIKPQKRGAAGTAESLAS